MCEDKLQIEADHVWIILGQFLVHFYIQAIYTSEMFKVGSTWSKRHFNAVNRNWNSDMSVSSFGTPSIKLVITWLYCVSGVYLLRPLVSLFYTTGASRCPVSKGQPDTIHSQTTHVSQSVRHYAHFFVTSSHWISLTLLQLILLYCTALRPLLDSSF